MYLDNTYVDEKRERGECRLSQIGSGMEWKGKEGTYLKSSELTSYRIA